MKLFNRKKAPEDGLLWQGLVGGFRLVWRADGKGVRFNPGNGDWSAIPALDMPFAPGDIVGLEVEHHHVVATLGDGSMWSCSFGALAVDILEQCAYWEQHALDLSPVFDAGAYEASLDRILNDREQHFRQKVAAEEAAAKAAREQREHAAMLAQQDEERRVRKAREAAEPELSRLQAFRERAFSK